jgi:hypothetical protein
MSANDPKWTSSCQKRYWTCELHARPIGIKVRKMPIREQPMNRTILLAICASVFGSQMIAAAEREMPKFDITAACRGSGSVQTPAKCMQDEQTARDQLAKQWSQYKQSDASRCIQITTSRAAAAGYVELLTCMQAAKIEEKAPTDPFGPLPSIAK